MINFYDILRNGGDFLILDMNNMFCFCSKLSKIDLSSFNTSSTENMSGLFFFCSNLHEVNISNIEFNDQTNMHGMFVNNPDDIRIFSGNKKLPKIAFEM